MIPLSVPLIIFSRIEPRARAFRMVGIRHQGGQRAYAKTVSKRLIEFHCLSSWYSEAKNKNVSKNDREKERGGRAYCQIL